MRSHRNLLLPVVFLTLGLTGCGLDIVDTVQEVFTEGPQADLRVDLPEGTALSCGAGPSVVVTIDNSGDAEAPESLTTFVFVPGGSVDVRTPKLGQNESTQLDPVAVPGACFVPDCRFTVLADASFLVDETDESNNRRDGSCPASAAPTP